MSSFFNCKLFQFLMLNYIKIAVIASWLLICLIFSLVTKCEVYNGEFSYENKIYDKRNTVENFCLLQIIAS